MITNYSFSYKAGLEQRNLHTVLRLFAVETLITGVILRCWSLPGQSAIILITPFIINSNRDFSYFLACILVKICLQYTLMFFINLCVNYESAVVVAQSVGLLQIFLIYLSHYYDCIDSRRVYITVDIFYPYAISREIVHARLIAQTIPSATEGYES